MTDTVLVYRPDVQEAPPTPIDLAPRHEIGAGSRLVLIDNGKAKAKELLTYLAAELQTRLPIASVEVVSKASAGYPLEDEHAEELAARADLVITGLGDCGACSACSLQDAIMFERLGVPATLMITEVFVGTVARFSESLGLPGYHTIVVPHPAATKSDPQLKLFAIACADAAIEQLQGQFASV
jgi:hypothetical protein